MSEAFLSEPLPAHFPPDGWWIHFSSLSAAPQIGAGALIGIARQAGRLVLYADSGSMNRRKADACAAAILQKQQSGVPAEALFGELCGCGTLLLWDDEKRLLSLGTDRLGGGRAFFRKNGETLTAANTLAAPLLRQGAALSAQAVHDYLSLQYVPEGTVFQEVTRLKGGRFICFNLLRGQEYASCWSRSVFAPDDKLSEEEAAARLREAVTSAVRRKLEEGGAHAAVLLSGGVDSAIVAGVAAANSCNPLEAYTVGFGETLYDERERAAATAEHLRRVTGHEIIHKMREVTPEDWPLFCKILKSYGEPYGDASLLATAALTCWAAGEGAELLLSGDGADEFFGGYERYRFMRLTAFLPPLPGAAFAAALLPGGGERSFGGRLKRLLPALGKRGLSRYFQLLDRFPEKRKKALYGAWMLDQAPSLRPTARLAAEKERSSAGIAPYQQWDVDRYMPGDVLVKTSLAAASAGVSVLSPFLEKEVTDLALHLPESLKIRGNCRKYLLSRAFPEFVPPELACRRKTGFGVPVGAWLRGPWKTHLLETLLEGPLVRQSVIRKSAAEKLAAEHLAGKRDRSYELWSLLTLALAWPENEA